MDEQGRHYIGWALDFRMRRENQDTIAAIAERHQERHEQQIIFTQQDIVHAGGAVQRDTNTPTTIALYTPLPSSENIVVDVDANEFEPHSPLHFTVARVPTLADLRGALEDSVEIQRPDSILDWRVWELQYPGTEYRCIHDDIYQNLFTSIQSVSVPIYWTIHLQPRRKISKHRPEMQ